MGRADQRTISEPSSRDQYSFSIKDHGMFDPECIDEDAADFFASLIRDRAKH